MDELEEWEERTGIGESGAARSPGINGESIGVPGVIGVGVPVPSGQPPSMLLN